MPNVTDTCLTKSRKCLVTLIQPKGFIKRATAAQYSVQQANKSEGSDVRLHARLVSNGSVPLQYLTRAFGAILSRVSANPLTWQTASTTILSSVCIAITFHTHWVLATSCYGSSQLTCPKSPQTIWKFPFHTHSYGISSHSPWTVQDQYAPRRHNVSVLLNIRHVRARTSTNMVAKNHLWHNLTKPLTLLSKNRQQASTAAVESLLNHTGIGAMMFGTLLAQGNSRPFFCIYCSLSHHRLIITFFLSAAQYAQHAASANVRHFNFTQLVQVCKGVNSNSLLLVVNQTWFDNLQGSSKQVL